MADLRIDDMTTAGAVAGLQAAANKLTPVIRVIQALDTEAAGTNTLADSLDQADQTLATALNSLGTELTALMTWITDTAAGLASTDQALASEAPP